MCKKLFTIKKIEDIDIATIFTLDELKKNYIIQNLKLLILDLNHGSVTIISENKNLNLQL